jgi:hypothetical protein
VPVVETYLHYRIEREEPGAGATQTYRAVDERTKAEVRLEVLASSAGPVEKGRFATRARRLKGLTHPSIAKTLEVGTTHAVFEAPAGPSLTEHAGLAIARSRQKLAWLAHLAGALSTLHAGGAVHGAVALDRVVLALDGYPKLLVSVGAGPPGSPMDDVLAFARAAVMLVLGAEPPAFGIHERLVEVGLPPEAAAALGRILEGKTLSAAALAEQLAPFKEHSGPMTEPLMPAVRPR